MLLSLYHIAQARRIVEWFRTSIVFMAAGVGPFFPDSFILFLCSLSNSGSYVTLYPFNLPGGRCISGRSARVFEGVWVSLEGRTSPPLVGGISTELGAARGLQVLAGGESEWFVSGVRPFGSEGALFKAAACGV